MAIAWNLCRVPACPTHSRRRRRSRVFDRGAGRGRYPDFRSLAKAAGGGAVAAMERRVCAE
jgi:hypothetical protein